MAATVKQLKGAMNCSVTVVAPLTIMIIMIMGGMILMQSNCINCGVLMIYDDRKKIPKKFCSDFCKIAYYKKREEITRDRETRWLDEKEEMIARRSIEIPFVSKIIREFKVYRMKRAAGFK